MEGPNRVEKVWQTHQIQQARTELSTSRAISTQLVHQPMTTGVYLFSLVPALEAQ